METVTRVAWVLLALVHVPPALVLFSPSLVQRLYAVSARGDAGILLVHRGALFLALVVACLWSVAQPDVRRLTSLLATISVCGFLATYLRAGMPAGALRTIGLCDAVALPPLAWVLLAAWRLRAA